MRPTFGAFFFLSLVKMHPLEVDWVCRARPIEQFYLLSCRKGRSDSIRALVAWDTDVPANFFPCHAFAKSLQELQKRLPQVAIEYILAVHRLPASPLPSFPPFRSALEHISRVGTHNDRHLAMRGMCQPF